MLLVLGLPCAGQMGAVCGLQSLVEATCNKAHLSRPWLDLSPQALLAHCVWEEGGTLAERLGQRRQGSPRQQLQRPRLCVCGGAVLGG